MRTICFLQSNLICSNDSVPPSCHNKSPLPSPALCHNCVFLTSVFLPLSPFSFSFLAFLPTGHSDEVASEEPSLLVITTVTHGGAAAKATRHPSPPRLLQETDISRCKFLALLLPALLCCLHRGVKKRRRRWGRRGEVRRVEVGNGRGIRGEEEKGE